MTSAAPFPKTVFYVDVSIHMIREINSLQHPLTLYRISIEGNCFKEKYSHSLELTPFSISSMQSNSNNQVPITSGAIHGYVPTKDILVVLFRNLDVPKSQIYNILKLHFLIIFLYRNLESLYLLACTSNAIPNDMTVHDSFMVDVN